MGRRDLFSKTALKMLTVLGGRAPSTLLNGLVAWWKMSETSDGSAPVSRMDSVGTNHLTDNGNIVGAGGVADLESTNSQYFSVADNPIISTGDIDFHFAIKLNFESVLDGWIVQKWSATNSDKEWILRLNAYTLEFLWYVNTENVYVKAVATNLGTPASNKDYIIQCWRDKTAQKIFIQVDNNPPNEASGATGGVDGAGPLWFGASNGGSVAFYDGKMNNAGMWKRLFTAGERTAIATGAAFPFDGTYRMTPYPNYVLFDGNSMTDGAFSSYPATAVSLLGSEWDYLNVGVSGATTITMLSDAVTQVDTKYVASRSKNVVVFWEVTNDLKLGATRADAQARMVTYCQGRQAAGFSVVIVTILPRTQVGLPVTFEDDRIAINTYIRDNYASFADVVADVASDSRIGDFGDSNDTTYYADGVHMTATGYNIVAGIVAAAVNSL